MAQNGSRKRTRGNLQKQFRERIVEAVGGPEYAAPAAFVAGGAILLTLLFIFEKATRTFAAETGVVVLTTVLLAGLIQVLTVLIRRWSLKGQRAAFYEFFGDEPVDGAVPDLFAPTLEPRYTPPRSDGARPVGTSAVPFYDLKAAISLAELFEKFNVPFKINRDRHLDPGEELERGCIAVGLGFNSMTVQIAASTRLFDVIFVPHEESGRKDDFVLDDQPHPPPSVDRDFALIVRAPTRCRDGKVRPMFLCAGRTAEGTAAAGCFLKRSWRTLYELYNEDPGHAFDEPLAIELEYEPRVLTSAARRRHRFTRTKRGPSETTTGTIATGPIAPIAVN